MMKYYLGSAAAAAILAAGAAFAQPASAPAPAPQVQVMTMHRGEAKTVTRDEVVAHVRDMFAKLDTNKDGVVTREEADAAHARMAAQMQERFAKRMAERGDMPKVDRGAIFDRLDKNHDGMISRDEFNSAPPQVQERRVTVMNEGGPGGMAAMHRMHAGMGFGGRLFDMADSNKDGRVSLQEATAMALQHFDSADLNHDGKLTPDERMQAHQRMRGQRQPA
jgi:Ca2+-binding EF-hand superfamily protein